MAENRLFYRHPKVKRHTLRIIEMHLAEKGATEIARATGLSRSSVYRVIADIMKNQRNARHNDQQKDESEA